MYTFLSLSVVIIQGDLNVNAELLCDLIKKPQGDISNN